jgi:hypothetical protein
VIEATFSMIFFLPAKLAAILANQYKIKAAATVGL